MRPTRLPLTQLTSLRVQNYSSALFVGRQAVPRRSSDFPHSARNKQRTQFSWRQPRAVRGVCSSFKATPSSRHHLLLLAGDGDRHRGLWSGDAGVGDESPPRRRLAFRKTVGRQKRIGAALKRGRRTSLGTGRTRNLPLRQPPPLPKKTVTAPSTAQNISCEMTLYHA